MSSDVKKDRAKLRRDIAKSAKPFSRSLFDDNDYIARSRVLQFLRLTEGLHAVNNKDQYGPDIVVFGGLSPKYYVEVEVKRVWEDPDCFPWETIQLPVRKAKYASLKLACEYWLLNSTLEAAIIIPSSELASSSRSVIPNRLVPEGEEFFQVSLDKCTIVKFGGTDADTKVDEK